MKPPCFPWAEPARVLRWVLAGLALASLLIPQSTPASGVVTNCTDADLRAALADGGLVTFACDGTIVLTNTLTITNSTSLDASGRSVSLSGSNAVRLFVIEPGATLTLRSLALVDGLARGTNGANGGMGQPGEPGQGGAVCNRNGVLNVYDCSFARHRAEGGTGGDGFFERAGNGGEATGGAIYNWLGSVQASNCSFWSNSAAGGAAGAGNQPGTGGAASGGAVYNWLGSVSTSNCVFAANRADGGIAVVISPFSASGGEARGGAFCNISGVVHMVSSILSSNVAMAGRGSRFGAAAAYGGSFFNEGDAALVASSLQANSAISSPMIGAVGGALSHYGLGILSLTDCTVSDNLVLGGAGLFIGTPAGIPGGPGLGGGLYIAASEARLTNTTLARNWAVGGTGVSSGVPAGQGGGLYAAGTVLLLNCTVVANTALGGQGRLSRSGDGEGGGLYNAAGGLLTLIHATVASNSALAGAKFFSEPVGVARGGAIAAAGGTVSLRSTILANSLSGSNCYGPGFVDEGHNLSSDASCNFTAPGSLNNTDPVLGPLTDYGGPTPTMALLEGSPAFDAVDPAFCPPTDQRGIARPFGAGCDIGAFESAPPYTILGQVHGFKNPASGIQVAATSTSTSASPDGQFLLHGFAAGTHLLSISSPECVFVPRIRSVTLGPDVVDMGFLSYRSNALVIERLSASAVRCVFAGEDGATYHVLSGTELSGFTPYLTNQVQSNGLFEFMQSTADAPKRFFQVVRP